MFSLEAIKSMFQNPNRKFEAHLLLRKRLCNLEIRIMMSKKNGDCLSTSSRCSVVTHHYTKSPTSHRSILLFTESHAQGKVAARDHNFLPPWIIPHHFLTVGYLDQQCLYTLSFEAAGTTVLSARNACYLFTSDHLR